MPVKANSVCSTQKMYEYPKLMISHNLTIILFSAFAKGVVVEEGKGSYKWEIGRYASDWEMSNFKDYHGDVTLTNC